MDEQTLEPYQPRLRWYSHAWRLALCLALSLAIWVPVAQSQLENHVVVFAIDIGLGVASYVLVFYRRRWPLAVALGLGAVSVVSGIAAGPATLAAVSLATRRRLVPIILVGLVSLAAGLIYSETQPYDGKEPLWVNFSFSLVATIAIMGCGMYIGSRRELLWTLRQRAARAEEEQELRVAQGRSQERERIAREMHDVLAHRITQISMQAGALAFRDDLPTDQLREGLDDIQGRANEAINELRGVLGVLRDHTGELVDGPQPTYSDIAGLVAEARGHGVHVELDDRVDRSVTAVPDPVGRALYRIIQEGLTNSTKHAPGAVVSVELSGSPGEGIDVRICNPMGFMTSTANGTGLGLVGLAERAELSRGTLVHGQEGRMFVLKASIPWLA